MSTDVDPADLRRLAEAATPGPWDFGCGLSDWAITTHSDDPGDDTHIATTPHGQDGEYIAAANPTVVLALLDELDALRAQVHSFASEIVQMHQDRDAYDTALEAQLEEALNGLDERDRIIIERDNEIAALRSQGAAQGDAP